MEEPGFALEEENGYLEELRERLSDAMLHDDPGVSISFELAKASCDALDVRHDLVAALQHLLTTMSITDEEGLLEFAEPVARARAAILKATSSSSEAERSGSPDTFPGGPK